MLLLLLGCQPEVSACQGDVAGHGVREGDGPCQVLPHWEHGEADPEWASELSASVSSPVDWSAVNAALADGPVRVSFAAGEYPEPLLIQRTDGSENRLLLDGGRLGARVPGIRTGYEVAPQSHITVRGFEVSGSDDKGVQWEAGSEVVLEELLVHDNAGSPAIYLDYSARSGHASSRFVLRNSHVFNQPGECVYVGGSEGLDRDSHARVELVNNLIHDCHAPLSTRHDAINVKDRIESVWVHRNVVFRADWGMEVASPGSYSHNLVFDTEREGFQVNDSFQPWGGLLVLEDNVVLRAGAEGIQIQTVHLDSAGEVRLERSVVYASGTAGLMLGGDSEQVEVQVRDIELVDNPVGIDWWGEIQASMAGCLTSGSGVDTERNAATLPACEDTTAQTPERLSGPDGVWFSEDDPWVGVVALPESLGESASGV